MMVELTSHVFDIPERLRELDPTLRVFFNSDTQKYEIWGLDEAREEYCLGEFSVLDCRVVAEVRKGIWLMCNKVRPWQEFLARIRAHNTELGEESDQYLRELEADAADAFKYFGTTLYPGFSIDNEKVV